MSASAEERLPKASARFFLRRLHSLSGVLPIGVFVVLHVGTQSRALTGQAGFDDAVKSRAAMPYVLILEVAFVLLPLLFHALYGVKLAFESKPTVSGYPGQRNWMHLAQRITGMLAFAFIVWHMSEYWLPRVMGRIDATMFYPLLVKNLSATRFGLPLAALGYVFGIAACVFHLANGLWGFCVTWGLTVTTRAQRATATVFGLLGLLLFVIGANTAIYFATGSRIAILGTPGSPVAATTAPAGSP